MQYLLEENEYTNLIEKVKIGTKKPSTRQLQKFCTMVAEQLILTKGWAKGRAWGCILTKTTTEYCDDCPSKEVCPYEYKKVSQ